MRGPVPREQRFRPTVGRVQGLPVCASRPRSCRTSRSASSRAMACSRISSWITSRPATGNGSATASHDSARASGLAPSGRGIVDPQQTTDDEPGLLDGSEERVSREEAQMPGIQAAGTPIGIIASGEGPADVGVVPRWGRSGRDVRLNVKQLSLRPAGLLDGVIVPGRPSRSPRRIGRPRSTRSRSASSGRTSTGCSRSSWIAGRTTTRHDRASRSRARAPSSSPSQRTTASGGSSPRRRRRSPMTSARRPARGRGRSAEWWRRTSDRGGSWRRWRSLPALPWSVE